MADSVAFHPGHPDQKVHGRKRGSKREGAILDGHHRWAAASAASMTPPPPPLRIPVLRVDMPIDDLLGVAQTMSGPRAGLEAPLAAAAKAAKAGKSPFGGKPSGPPPDADQPWLWFDGKWVLMSMDTTDGVPASMDLPEEPKPTDQPTTAAGGSYVEDECPPGEHKMPDGKCMPDEAMATQPGEHFHTVVMEGVSTGKRKFAPESLSWREPPFAFHWQQKSSAHSGTPETVQVGLVTRAERHGDTIHFWGPLDLRSPEGLDYARRLADGFARWSSVGLDESLKDADVEFIYPQPPDGVPPVGPGEVVEVFGEPDEMIFHKGRIAEISGVSVPALADATVEPTPELLAALAELGVIAPAVEPAPEQEPAPEPQEESEPIAATAAATPIVAAGYTVTIPDLPPAAWFDEPVDASPHGELRVDESGRICGYLAPAGVAHRAFRNRRVEVPMGRVDYDGWMNKAWPVAEGHKVYVGVITMDCGHASTNPADASYTLRREHYDDSCSVAAHARIGENRHGVWIAGALAPWVDAEGLGRLMSCQLSGDWASHRDRPGWQDFIAALLVPVPGFPNRVPSASVRVADGALVASAVPVRMVHSGETGDLDLRPVLERMARSIGRDTATRMAALHARVHRDR